MKYLLDTNLLLRTANANDPHYAIAMQSVEALLDAGEEVVVVPQVLYEFWVAVTRPTSSNGFGYTTQQAIIAVEKWRQTLQLIEDQPGLYAIWLDLVGRYGASGKPAHDARLVAAMIHHGIDRLLTFNDIDFKRFSEISVASPLALQSP